MSCKSCSLVGWLSYVVGHVGYVVGHVGYVVGHEGHVNHVDCELLFTKFDTTGFIVSTYMVLVHVFILFNGVWIEQNDEYRFKGFEAKGIMIPRSRTYAELIENIS